MCGRIAFTTLRWRQLVELLRIEVLPEHQPLFRPRYNLGPTQQHWIVCQSADGRQLLSASWGFQSRGGLLINARAETADKLPTFRRLLVERRCVVPADGFYEWKGRRGERQPLWFHPPGEGLLLMAGLYRQEMTGERSFVIITTAANDSVRPVHDRMPALLSPEQAASWLAGAEGALLQPAPEGSLEVHPVSARVNSLDFDTPECLTPVEPEEPDQLSLFGE